MKLLLYFIAFVQYIGTERFDFEELAESLIVVSVRLCNSSTVTDLIEIPNRRSPLFSFLFRIGAFYWIRL